MPRVCQFTEILQRFHGAPSVSIYGDFMVPRVRLFTEILHDVIRMKDRILWEQITSDSANPLHELLPAQES